MSDKTNQADVFEDHAVSAVPKEQQRSFTGMFMVYTGVLVCMAVIWTGGELGRGLALNNMILAILGGSVITAIIGLLTGIIGGYTRTSTYVILRHSFGRYGSMVAGAAVSGISCGIGWFFIQAWLFSEVMETISLELWGSVPYLFQGHISAFWGAILMTLTAIFGFKGLALLSYVTVPLFIVILGGGSVAAITEAGGFSQIAQATPAEPMTIGAAITAIVGSYIAGATISPDIARYAAKPTHGGWAWFWQVLFMQPLLFLAAGLLTLLTPQADVAEAMAHLGIGVGALLIVILGQWTTNDNNLYNGALAFANTIKVKKAVITGILGFVGAILASLTALGVFGADPFMTFLNQLGRFLPPIAGILIADFYILKPYLQGKKDPENRYQFGPGTEYACINWVGILSWIGAGYFSVYLPGIVALNSILLSFIAFIILTYTCEMFNIQYTSGSYVEESTGF
ncbi:purine-cytosine permease family protein [Natranaerobius thermophilus]|uniref:Permease for cytosine/purines uracil thiamine allantoin n=1 Tax=Natranaerobius thermophilus (strain ATCC BAA-1301 / DSM 18059 / JW/NM-WN-LF) TaxID=457570 RepID=B2A881_NATTJ|nr:cytosine permease [Natranaerobius thermophilus]ACB84447.1 permease for cytosine/purines uracil thiamine allantoin [Natranaerobius thermophilus JW/NM-WN-LF]